MNYVKRAFESVIRKDSQLYRACASIRTERYTRLDSRYRIREILLLATMLPVVFLDACTAKAWIVALVLLLEAAAFVFSFFRAIEQTKTGQKHPWLGVLQFLLVALVVDLCLLGVCRLKYTALFVDESEKFMLACFLRKGYRLYDTVFCHHGPFTVMLSHLVYLLHPANDIGVFRAPGFLVLLLPSIVFLFSDIVPKRHLQITLSLLFPSSYLLISYLYSCLSSSALPFSIVLYQFYGAVFVGCALILLYPLLFQDRYHRWHLFWAGMFLSFAFFSAISFSVSIFLIFVMMWIFFVCNYPQSAKEFFKLMFFAYGGIAGFLLVLIYLLAFGSVRGFIDQHIIFNLQVYAKYIGYDGSASGYLGMLQQIPGQIVHGRVFYLALLTLFVLLYPLLFSVRAGKGKAKRKVLHFLYCVLIILAALFSGRTSPFEYGFVLLNQTAYVIMILAACALLAGLTPVRAWLVIAAAFLTLLIEKVPNCHLSRPTFAPLRQKQIASSELVQTLTGPDDPVLFYPLGFADYIGENRLPGGVFFPFMTSWIYEYGRDRLFDEISRTPPTMIQFYYSDDVWYLYDAMISECLDFMRSRGYMRILGTDYYILPDRCPDPEALARYELAPIARQYLNIEPGQHRPFEEINCDRPYGSPMVYPAKLDNRMVTGITFRFATYGRTEEQLDGQLEVSFLNEQDEIMEVFSMDCPDLEDNHPVVFAFENPCRPASVRIATTSSPWKGFTVWVDSGNQLIFEAFTDPVSLSRHVRRGSAPVPD